MSSNQSSGSSGRCFVVAMARHALPGGLESMRLGRDVGAISKIDKSKVE